MIGIARRKVADRLRRHRPTVEISENGKGSRFDHLADETMHIEHVLALLTDDQREALTLKYVVGMTSEEVATAVGKSSEAVDSLLQRGRAAFAREWDALLSEQVIS
jgi:RNA polymerase sigma factor (sigma-70 family)